MARGRKLMADFQLKNGSEVDFDLDTFTIDEYSQFRAGTLPGDGDYDFMAKVIGMKVDEVKNLPFMDWKRMVKAFFKKATRPLDDPN